MADGDCCFSLPTAELLYFSSREVTEKIRILAPTLVSMNCEIGGSTVHKFYTMSLRCSTDLKYTLLYSKLFSMNFL